MAVERKVLHYFVINQLGGSADRRGPFESEEAARHWADNHYAFPAWILPAAPCAKAKSHKLLDKDGNPVEPKE